MPDDEKPKLKQMPIGPDEKRYRVKLDRQWFQEGSKCSIGQVVMVAERSLPTILNAKPPFGHLLEDGPESMKPKKSDKKAKPEE